MEPVHVCRGGGPVILAFPHAGTEVPAEVAARLNDEGRLLRDTDWHIDELYADLIPDLTTVTATQSRYVIDLNRDPSGGSLYPGQTTTGLVPETTFDNVPIWQEGMGPTTTDITARLAAVHRPYHAALAAEVERVRARHGVAILYDCHSIRSVIPWLFSGTLPDFNIGTDGGRTCAPEIERIVRRICEESGRPTIVNGRFRGGWTTRHYGRPERGVHALQMELAQISHLVREEPPFVLDSDRSMSLRTILGEILAALVDLSPRLASR